MWPATALLAEAPAWQQYILPAALALLATLGAAFLALRGTFRTADTTREVEFDKQVDADRAALRAEIASLKDENARLRVELETKTADRDRYRELHAQLRLDVFAAGLDPDRLGKGGSGAPRNTRRH